MILLLAVAPSRPLPLSSSTPWWPDSAAFNPNYPLSHPVNPSIFLSILPSLHPSGGSVPQCSSAPGSLCSAPRSCVADEASRSISRLSPLTGSTSQVSVMREEISGDPTRQEREASGESRGRQQIMTFYKLLHLLRSVSLHLSLFGIFREHYYAINSDIVKGNKISLQNRAEYIGIKMRIMIFSVSFLRVDFRSLFLREPVFKIKIFIAFSFVLKQAEGRI